MMLKTLFLPHYWQLSRRFNQTHKYLIVTIITIGLIIGEWGFKRLANIPDLTSDQTVVLVVLSGVLMMVFIGIIDLKNIIYQLFSAPDLALLMVNPVPLSTIYLYKGIQCGWRTGLGGVLLAGYLIMVGINRQLPLIFYPVSLLGIIAWMAIVIALLLLLVFVLVRWISPQRFENWGFLVLIILPALVITLQEPLLSAFLNLNLSFDGILKPNFYLPFVLISGIVAILLQAITFQAFKATFYRATTQYRVESAKPISSGTLSSSLMMKEWLMIRRELRLLIGFAQPLIFFGLLLVSALNNPEPASLRVLGFWLILVLISVSSITNINTTTQIMLNEGRNIDLLKTQPIHPSRLLISKLSVIVLLQIIFWGIGILILSGFYQLELWAIGRLFGALFIVQFGVLPVMLSITAWQADFQQQPPTLPFKAWAGIVLWNGLWAGMVFVSISYSVQDTLFGQAFDQLNLSPIPEYRLFVHFGLLFMGIVGLVIWRKGINRLMMPLSETD